jgi:AcrR family transcriptional regulator
MGIQERRERERARRAEEILDAAVRVIEQKSIEDFTMEEVAEEAELGKATVYSYFSSKHEILLHLHHRATDLLGRMFEQAVQAQGSAAERLTRIGRAYAQFWDEQPVYREFISSFSARKFDVDTQAVSEHVRNPLAVMERVIEEGHADGSIRTAMRPAVLARLLWATNTGVHSLFSVFGDQLAAEQQIYRSEAREAMFLMLQFGFAEPDSNGHAP